MQGISRGLRGRASWLCLVAAACGGGRAETPGGSPAPGGYRTIPLARAIVLETAGPPPGDTSVTFITGEPRTIILRHGPPANIVFAELEFSARAFGPDSGRQVQVEVRPRPGLYGLDVAATLPIGPGASVMFKYARYFSAPERARAVYGSDGAFERALAVGQLRSGGTLTLLPSTRPSADNLRAPLPAAGSYLVAAPQ